MLSDIAQGAFGALIDRPEVASRMALAAAARLGLADDAPPAQGALPAAGWPTWKLMAAAGAGGVLGGVLLGLYLQQRHGRYVPNLFGK